MQDNSVLRVQTPWGDSMVHPIHKIVWVWSIFNPISTHTDTEYYKKPGKNNSIKEKIIDFYWF